MSPQASPASCWVITDSAAGNQRQALALAGCLALPTHQLVLQPRAPWSWLSPRLTLAGTLALSGPQRAAFAPPWPRVAIGCGRSAALFTRLLRGLSQGQCHTVQILDPRIDPAHWDTVIAPRHDRVAGANVLHTLGSLNPVDAPWLAAGRAAFPALAGLPQPRTGVLLGGPRQGIALGPAQARHWAERLRHRQRREGGSLLVLASRRTPAAVLALLRQALADTPGLLWAGAQDGPNPYAGVLGWADRLVVTPDSVNMLSEACAVGCPVHTLVDARLPPKLARFHRELHDAGWLHDLDAVVAAQPPPLRETAALAARVSERLALGSATPGTLTRNENPAPQ